MHTKYGKEFNTAAETHKMKTLQTSLRNGRYVPAASVQCTSGIYNKKKITDNINCSIEQIKVSAVKNRSPSLQ